MGNNTKNEKALDPASPAGLVAEARTALAETGKAMTRLERLFCMARDHYASSVPMHLELWLVPTGAEERGDHDVQADPSEGEPLEGTWHADIAEGCAKATGATPEDALDALGEKLRTEIRERIARLQGLLAERG